MTDQTDTTPSAADEVARTDAVPDEQLATPDAALPDAPGEPLAAADSTAEPAAGVDDAEATADDLDDLLGMAGADDVEDVVADDPAAEEAIADAAQDIADDPVTEAEEPTPARPRRPTSVDQVRDQRELRRMFGDWYVVHTYAGYEQRVKDNLSNRIDTYEVGDRIHEIVIPTEEVTEYKKGKKTISDKKFLPGYVLVRMDMDDDTWGIVRHTPAVTGFVGASGIKPVPLSIREVGSTLKIPVKYVEETEEPGAEGGTPGEVVPEKPQVDIDMEVGDTVRVTTGPFADFTGTIAEINIDQAKLKVMVSVFGRETPIELPFDNVASI